MNDESQLVAVLGKLPGALNGCTLLDVLQNLLIARLVSHDEQPAARLLHRFQSLEIGGDPRSARPRQSQRLQLGAQFDRARFLDIESIVVKEKFFDVRPQVFRLRHLARYVVARALPPRMSTQSLRPQAEGALRRASSRGVKRYIRTQQERYVVPGHIEVALVNLRDVRQRIQILDLRCIRIVNDLAVLQKRNPGNLLEWL